VNDEFFPPKLCNNSLSSSNLLYDIIPNLYFNILTKQYEMCSPELRCSSLCNILLNFSFASVFLRPYIFLGSQTFVNYVLRLKLRGEVGISTQNKWQCILIFSIFENITDNNIFQNMVMRNIYRILLRTSFTFVTVLPRHFNNSVMELTLSRGGYKEFYLLRYNDV
jgi:hypothetical protein